MSVPGTALSRCIFERHRENCFIPERYLSSGELWSSELVWLLFLRVEHDEWWCCGLGLCCMVLFCLSLFYGHGKLEHFVAVAAVYLSVYFI